MDEKLTFARNVIKGKITEIVFEFIFRNNGAYTVIPFGYEYSEPEIAQHINILRDKGILDTLRHAPDFILISTDKTEVYFVEVKYRKDKDLDLVKVKDIAEKLVSRWDHAWLFIATPYGFYYEPCHTIINNNGKIGRLYTTTIPQEVQDKYLHLLNEFEKV